MSAHPVGACVRCHTPLEEGDLRCVICSMPAPVVANVSERALAKVLRCDSCGAAVKYQVEARAPKCGFCNSVMHLETPEDPIEEAEGYLPFKVDRDEARQAVRKWLSGLGFFRPSDLAKTASVEGIKPLWWVGWSCDADALVSWAADSNAGSRRSAWAPHAGQGEIHYDNLVVSASRGLTGTETSTLTPSYRDHEIFDDARGPDGASEERFDVQRSAARAQVLDGLHAASMAKAKSWVPGSRIRNLKIALRLKKLETRRLAFPAYIMAYRYRDKVYRAVVHGQDASNAFGTAPYSWPKIIGVACAAVAILALAVFILAR